MLTQWCAWQQAQGLSERTIIDRNRVMRLLTEHSKSGLAKITSDHIIDFCRRDSLSQSSKASYHASIRAFYKWATLTNNINEDPTLATPSPRRPKGQPRPLHTAHISELLRAANRKRTHAMITLAAYAGLRVHEVAKFHGSDLDRISQVITVTGKGGKTAMIPAHEAIVTLDEQFPKNCYWFPSYSGDRPHVDSKAVSKAISGVMRRIGLQAQPHQLRHWYATELLDSGVDIRIVKELMRHESIATTQIYTRVSMKHMYEGIAALKTAA